MDYGPCSVPRALRLIFPKETPAQQAICEAHDAAYTLGGTRRDRAVADARLLLGMLVTDMDIDRAHAYHSALRVLGKSHWPGGRYTDEPPDAPPVSTEAP